MKNEKRSAHESHRGGAIENGPLWKALAAGGEPRPAHDLWPRIEERTLGRASRVSLLPLRFAGAAAAVAGVVIGVFLGSHLARSGEGWQQETWAELGSIVTEESQASLDNIYLSLAEEGGREP